MTQYGYKLYTVATDEKTGKRYLAAPVQSKHRLNEGLQTSDRVPTEGNFSGFHFARAEELTSLLQTFDASWHSVWYHPEGTGIASNMLLVEIEPSGKVLHHEVCSRCEHMRPSALIPDEKRWNSEKAYRALVRQLAYDLACAVTVPVRYDKYLCAPPPLKNRINGEGSTCV